jgi:ribosomal protein S27E
MILSNAIGQNQELKKLSEDIDWLIDTSSRGKVKVRCQNCGSTFPITIIEANVPEEWGDRLTNIKCNECNGTDFRVLSVGVVA